MKYRTFVCICGNEALKKNLRKKNPYLGVNPIHIKKLRAQNCDKNREKNRRKTNRT